MAVLKLLWNLHLLWVLVQNIKLFVLNVGMVFIRFFFGICAIDNIQNIICEKV